MTVLSISWVEIEHKARALAEMIEPFGPYVGILAITRGGLAPAQMLAHLLDIRAIDTIGIVSYHDKLSSKPKVVKTPSTKVGTGQGWLVVDDLSDTGTTFSTIRKLYPDAKFVALYAKPQGIPHIDHFVSHVEQSVWLEFPWEKLSSQS